MEVACSSLALAPWWRPVASECAASGGGASGTLVLPARGTGGYGAECCSEL